MKLTKTLTLASILLVAGLAGCITAPTEEYNGENPTPPTRTPTGKPMTATDDAWSDATCEGSNGRKCAAKLLHVEGEMNLGRIDIDLHALSAIRIKGGPEGFWSMDVLLSAEGEDDASARENLDKLELTWSHLDGAKHVLSVTAARKTTMPSIPVNVGGSGSNNENLGARFDITVPASVVASIAADTTNGGIHISGLATDGVQASTTNGGISLDISATSVDARTTNGGVDGIIKTTGSGKITARATNGGVGILVTESSERGYDAKGSATNGGVSITLTDGTVGGESKSRTFKTTNYAARTIQTQIDASVTNGGVVIGRG